MPPLLDIARKKLKSGVTIWTDKKYLDALVEAGIGEPQIFINKHADSVIDDVARSKITSVSIKLENKLYKVAAKEYLPRGGLSLLKNIFRRSKAVTEFLFCSKLYDMGVPAPLPIAAVEIRNFRILDKAYLFSEELYGSKSLLELMDKRENSNLNREQLNQVIEGIAEIIAQAHEKGFFHGDLNASHIIIKNWKDKSLRTYLIDFENSKILSSISNEHRIRDISRLEKSASYFLPISDRIRFLKYYIQKTGNSIALREMANKVKAEVARRSK